MGDEKSPIMAGRERERDRELLIPGGEDAADESDSKASSSNAASSHHHNAGREVSSIPVPQSLPLPLVRAHSFGFLAFRRNFNPLEFFLIGIEGRCY